MDGRRWTVKPTAWYLATLGRPLRVWRRSFRTMAEARRYRDAHGLSSDCHAFRGSTLLNWSESKGTPIVFVEVEEDDV